MFTGKMLKRKGFLTKKNYAIFEWDDYDDYDGLTNGDKNS